MNDDDGMCGGHTREFAHVLEYNSNNNNGCMSAKEALNVKVIFTISSFICLPSFPNSRVPEKSDEEEDRRESEFLPYNDATHCIRLTGMIIMAVKIPSDHFMDTMQNSRGHLL